MKNYKVRALREFNDIVEGKLRSPKNENAEFFCDKERYEYLVSKKAVELLEVQETIDDVVEEEIANTDETTEEKVQAVEEAVNETVEEATEEPEVQNEVEEETQEDAVVNEIIKKNKSSKK